MVSIRYGVHSGLCPFWIVSIRDCVHSGLYPFGIVSIRNCVHSGLCPFGIVSIRDCVHPGLCPSELYISGLCVFGQLSEYQISKGVKSKLLVKASNWLRGPQLLKETFNNLPDQPEKVTKLPDEFPMLKKVNVLCVLVCEL